MRFNTQFCTNIIEIVKNVTLSGDKRRSFKNKAAFYAEKAHKVFIICRWFRHQNVLNYSPIGARIRVKVAEI